MREEGGERVGWEEGSLTNTKGKSAGQVKGNKNIKA